jgi:hypothetical protein
LDHNLEVAIKILESGSQSRGCDQNSEIAIKTDGLRSQSQFFDQTRSGCDPSAGSASFSINKDARRPIIGLPEERMIPEERFDRIEHALQRTLTGNRPEPPEPVIRCRSNLFKA